MDVAGVGQRIDALGPESRNGNGAGGDQDATSSLIRNLVIVAAPLLIAGVAAAVGLSRRRDTGDSQVADGVAEAARQVKGAVEKAKPKRHKPKNLPRYYGLTVLIAALERDSTRKALINALKWVQKRS